MTSAEQTVYDIAKNLKLTGLAWVPDSDEEKMTMIEDSDSGITYFLREGEEISSFSVKDILNDSVVLRYDNSGEEIKLR